MRPFLLLILALTFNFSVFGQVDPSATKSVNQYLEAIKLIDLPESKITLKRLQFEEAKSYPVFTDTSTLAERSYPTDIPNVFSYRRLLSVKGINKLGTEIIKKYAIVAYKDQTTQQWKIFGFNEGTDLEYEASAAGKNLDESKYIKPKYNYRRYFYWSVMAGQLIQAQEALKKAKELNEADSSVDIEPITFKVSLDELQKTYDSITRVPAKQINSHKPRSARTRKN